MARKCSSCGKEVVGKYSEFKCPQCGGSSVVRCSSCRTLGTTYVCGKCSFKGP